jgi:hypothetical protein
MLRPHQPQLRGEASTTSEIRVKRYEVEDIEDKKVMGYKLP